MQALHRVLRSSTAAFEKNPVRLFWLKGPWDLVTRVAFKGSFKGSIRVTIEGSVWVLRVFRGSRDFSN